MTRLLQVNQRIVTAQEIISLLAGYQLLPKLLRELIIDEAISPFSYTLEEREKAYQKFSEKNQLVTEEQRQAWLDFPKLLQNN